MHKWLFTLTHRDRYERNRHSHCEKQYLHRHLQWLRRWMRMNPLGSHIVEWLKFCCIIKDTGSIRFVPWRDAVVNETMRLCIITSNSLAITPPCCSLGSEFCCVTEDANGMPVALLISARDSATSKTMSLSNTTNTHLSLC